jgi:protease I
MKQKLVLSLLALFCLSACKSMPTHPSAHEATKEKMLKGMRVAVLITDGFEEVEMTKPRKALQDAGAEVIIVSPRAHRVQGYNHNKKAHSFKVDLTLNKAYARNFDALLLPGGVKNPDELRANKDAVAFIKEIGADNKPIAAICHGPWSLINAELVKGQTLTSWPSLEADLKNAGARWVDEEVVVDKNLVTSRKPEDIPVFNDAMIRLFAKHKK